MNAKQTDFLYREIGKRIIKARTSKGWTQEHLASEAGLDRSHLGFIEQGRRKPTISTIYKITSSLGIKFENFFKGL